jgi:XTP/dITP diphosphohydrolase
MHSVIIATNNRHKLEEIQFALRDDIILKTLQEIGCTEELAEDQDTIEGNSFQKADYVYRKYNVDVFADDSGLEVEALNGAPGVHSAYYGGPQRSHKDNNELLQKNLSGKTNRNARFKTVITLIWKGQVHVFEGLVNGTMTLSPRGTGGFGYDPYFLPEGHSRTLAEMTMEEKNEVSARAIAVRKLANFLNLSR